MTWLEKGFLLAFIQRAAVDALDPSGFSTLLLFVWAMLFLWAGEIKPKPLPSACPMCGLPLPTGIGTHRCSSDKYTFRYEIKENHDYFDAD